MFVINIVAVISNLCVVTVNKYSNNVPFSTIIQFFRVPLNVLFVLLGVHLPQVGSHCSGGSRSEQGSIRLCSLTECPVIPQRNGTHTSWLYYLLHKNNKWGTGFILRENFM
jgi:hypothetical protein